MPERSFADFMREQSYPPPVQDPSQPEPEPAQSFTDFMRKAAPQAPPPLSGPIKLGPAPGQQWSSLNVNEDADAYRKNDAPLGEWRPEAPPPVPPPPPQPPPVQPVPGMEKLGGTPPGPPPVPKPEYLQPPTTTFRPQLPGRAGDALGMEQLSTGKPRPQLDQSPVGEGVEDVIHGVQQAAQPEWKEKALGASKVIGGAMKAATPLIAGDLVAAPLATAAVLAAGTGIQVGSEKLLAELGLPEEYATLVGDLAGLFGAGLAHVKMQSLAKLPYIREGNAIAARLEAAAKRAGDQTIPPGERAAARAQVDSLMQGLRATEAGRPSTSPLEGAAAAVARPALPSPSRESKQSFADFVKEQPAESRGTLTVDKAQAVSGDGDGAAEAAAPPRAAAPTAVGKFLADETGASKNWSGLPDKEDVSRAWEKTKDAVKRLRGETNGIGEFIEMVPVKELAGLREYDRATDEKFPGHFQGVLDHVRANGITEPVMIKYDPASKRAYIGEGNTRLAAAEALGFPAVPVRVVRSGVPSDIGAGSVVRGPEGRANADMAPSEIGVPPGGGRLFEEARGEGGKIKMGADVKSLGQVLGSSLYGGQPEKIIPKELLQNAMDAVRGVKGGKVTLKVGDANGEEYYRGSGDMHITVGDNGPGMTKHQLETVFMDLGASGKRDQEGASGGFGLAKAAPLMMSKELHLATVVQEPTGLFRHSFVATPEQLLGEGVQVKSERVPAGTPTGTTIRSVLDNKDGDLSDWEALAMGKRYGKSINLPGELWLDSGYPKKVSLDRELRPLAEETIPGVARIVMHESAQKRTGLSEGSISLEINNHGIYQFDHSMYPEGGAKMEGVPETIAVDVQALAPEGSRDYPFTANREALRGKVLEAIEKAITEKIIKPAAQKGRNFIAEKYQSLPSFAGTKGTKYDPAIPFYDVGARMDPHEVQAVLNDPHMIRLAKGIRDIAMRAIQEINKPGSMIAEAFKGMGLGIERVGIVFSEDLHGVYIKNPTDLTKATVLLNPFSYKDGESVAQVAAGVWHTILHEIVHDKVSGHYERFTQAEREIFAAVADVDIRSIMELRSLYGDKTNSGGPAVRGDYAGTIQAYQDSRGRSERERDPFGGEKQSVQPGDPAAVAGRDDAGVRERREGDVPGEPAAARSVANQGGLKPGSFRRFWEDETGASKNLSGLPDKDDAGQVLGSGLGALQRHYDRAVNALKADVDATKALIAKRDLALAGLNKAMSTPTEKEAGRRILEYFTGERDLWGARMNQVLDHVKKMVPSTAEQEGLSLMRDFKSRPGELQQWLSGTHSTLASLPTAERQIAVGRIEKMRPAIEAALNPTPGMAAADQVLTKIAEASLAEGQARGFLKSGISNDEYVTHLLRPSDLPEFSQLTENSGRSLGGKIGRNFGPANKREYATLLDAVADNVKPRTLNAITAFTIHADKFATARATRMMIGELKDTGMGKWGTGRDKIPQGWVEIAPHAHPFQNTVNFLDAAGEPASARQTLFVPKFIEEALRPTTDPDYSNKIQGFTKLRGWQAYTKAVQLGMSLFHATTENYMAVANMGPRGWARALRADRTTPEFREAERRFIAHGGTTSIQGNTFEAYRSLDPGRIPSWGDIWQKMPVVHEMDKVAQRITDFTFGKLQRQFKVTDFSMHEAAWMAKNPGATAAQRASALQSIAKEVNAVYGGLHWENLGVNRTSLNMARAIMLAPDWTFSNLFNVKYAAENSPAGSLARKFWIRQVVGGLVMTQAMSLLLSRKPSPRLTQVYLGKDRDGQDIYQNMFFKGSGGDLVNLVNNVRDYGAVTGLAKTFVGKAAPGLRTLGSLGLNRNFLGQEIVPKGTDFVPATARGAAFVLKDASPIPLSGRNLWDMMTGPKAGRVTMPEYFTTIFAGTPPSHVPPPGWRMTDTGLKPKREPPPRSWWDQYNGTPAPRRPRTGGVVPSRRRR